MEVGRGFCPIINAAFHTLPHLSVSQTFTYSLNHIKPSADSDSAISSTQSNISGSMSAAAAAAAAAGGGGVVGPSSSERPTCGTSGGGGGWAAGDSAVGGGGMNLSPVQSSGGGLILSPVQSGGAAAGVLHLSPVQSSGYAGCSESIARSGPSSMPGLEVRALATAPLPLIHAAPYSRPPLPLPLLALFAVVQCAPS